MYWRQRIVNQLVINWRQLAPAIEQLTFNSPLAPINWMDWRQSNWLPIEVQLNDNWTFNELASIEWQLASIVNQFIEWHVIQLASIECSHSIDANWCTIEFNDCQLTPIGVNWTSIECHFFRLNDIGANWCSIPEHSIELQLTSIESKTIQFNDNWIQLNGIIQLNVAVILPYYGDVTCCHGTATSFHGVVVVMSWHDDTSHVV